MRTITLLAALVLALPVAAQTAKPVPPVTKVPAAPTITDAQKAAYWKAQAQQSAHTEQANLQAKQDQAVVANAIQTMSDTCGKDYVLQGSATGDPVCVLKPAEKK